MLRALAVLSGILAAGIFAFLVFAMDFPLVVIELSGFELVKYGMSLLAGLAVLLVMFQG